MPLFSRKPKLDWTDVCAQKNIQVESDAILAEALNGDCDLWLTLLDIAAEHFKAIKSSRVADALAKFKEALDNQLQLDEKSQSYFDGDFVVFTQFILLQRGIIAKPALDLSLIWPAQVDSEARYEALVIQLINGHFEALLKELHQKKAKDKEGKITKQLAAHWEHELGVLSSLIHYSDVDNEAASEIKKTSAGIVAAIRGWLTKLVHFFSTQEKTPGTIESLAVLNQAWSTTKRHGFLPNLLSTKTTNNPFDYFHRVDDITIREQRTLSLKHFKPGKWFSNPVKQLIKNCDKDIERLDTWAHALFHSALMHYIEEPNDLSAFLEAFKKMQEEMRSYGEALYACRMKAESVFQKSKGSYLKKLDDLDTKLARIEKRIITLQRDCIADVKDALKEDDNIQQACRCFEVLLSDEMINLEAVSWAEHTCYCKERTEKRIFYEMQARNAKHEALYQEPLFSNYETYVTFTQTDYVLTQHLTDQSKALLKKMLYLHPDKVSNELKKIAEYCTNEVATQRDRCAKVSRAWYLSGSYAPAPNQEEKLSQDELDFYKDQEPTFILEPASPLGLGMMSLHLDYLGWAKGQDTLAKSPLMGLGVQHLLYSRKEDAFEIACDYGIRTLIFQSQMDKKERDRKFKEIKDNFLAKVAAEIQEENAKAQEHRTKRQEAEARIWDETLKRQEAEARIRDETLKRQEAEARIQEHRTKRQEAEARIQDEALKKQEAEVKMEKVDEAICGRLRKKLGKYIETNPTDFDRQELERIYKTIAKQSGQSIHHAANLMHVLILNEAEFEILRPLIKWLVRNSVGEDSNGFFQLQSSNIASEPGANSSSTREQDIVINSGDDDAHIFKKA